MIKDPIPPSLKILSVTLCLVCKIINHGDELLKLLNNVTLTFWVFVGDGYSENLLLRFPYADVFDTPLLVNPLWQRQTKI